MRVKAIIKKGNKAGGKALLNIKPKISVIMPVYNAEKYISKAIDSILGQTEEDFELILIDDCGTDNSMGIVRDYKDKRIRIVQNEKNKGISYSRNKGINVAKGEYIALMDDDDIAPSDRFDIEINYMREHPDIDVIGGISRAIDENGNIIEYLPSKIICNPNRIYAELLFGDKIANGSTMIRTEFIRKNNLYYKDGFLGMEDYKFWTECAVVGKIANIDKILLYWRKTKENETYHVISKKSEERKIKYAEIQKEALLAYGFELSNEEIKLFTDVFKEKTKEYISIKGLCEVLLLLKKMAMQAETKNMKNVEELKIVFQKMFALKTENSEIWITK